MSTPPTQPIDPSNRRPPLVLTEVNSGQVHQFSGNARRAANDAVRPPRGGRRPEAARHFHPTTAANDACLPPGDPDQTVLRWCDLRVAPSPVAVAMLLCAMPLLVLAATTQAVAAGLVGFGLFAMVLAGTVMAVRTLRGLSLICRPPRPCFSGDMAMVEVRLINTARRSRRAIAISLGDYRWDGLPDCLDVPAGAARVALLPLPVTGRGLQALPDVRLRTQHAFGLVRVSAAWRPASSLRVRRRPALVG